MAHPTQIPVERLLECTRLLQARRACGASVTECSVIAYTARALSGMVEGAHCSIYDHRARATVCAALLAAPGPVRARLRSGRGAEGPRERRYTRAPSLGNRALQTAAGWGPGRVTSRVGASARLESAPGSI